MRLLHQVLLSYLDYEHLERCLALPSISKRFLNCL